MPLWADNPKAQWERRAIPLHLCAPGDAAQRAYFNWLEEAIEDLNERLENFKTIADVRQQLANFNIPFLSLPVATGKEIALDVFINMNTSATPLSAYDIVVAQVEAGMGESLHDLVANTKKSCPDIERYYEPEELVLAAGALLQGRVPSRINYLSDDFGKQLIENWDKYLKGIERTANFLQEERIFDAARLPTDVVVPVLVALWSEVPIGLDAEGNARSIIRKYIWRAFFTSRYERSTATRSYADYDEIKSYLADPTDPAPSILDEDLPQISELIDTGWPKKKDRLARAILALSLKEGGLDLADGSSAIHGNLSQREYHHLFPVAHLKRENPDISDDKIFNALNCALVTWRTNRAISDKEPVRYLTDRLQDSDPEGTEIKRRLESHLIPYDDMVSGDYDAFLQKRAELVLRTLKKLCD